MKNQTQKWLENSIYILIWLVVFFVPVLGYKTDTGISWQGVKFIWLKAFPFLLLFIINNYLLIPLFMQKRRFAWYAISVFLVMILFFSPLHRSSQKEHSAAPPFGLHQSNHPSAMEHGNEPAPRPDFRSQRAMPRTEHPPEIPPHPMPVEWDIMLNFWLLAILVVGFNIAVRLFFKSVNDARRMQELESQTLKTELDYLKAQINPHFFMNTLNNIHALIDIDTEKAKEIVIELSKIMRYVLYEADHPVLPLAKEIEFLNNYLALMKIRYTEDVKTECDFVVPASEIVIPPLLLITFIENAFKHGIIEEKISYIHVKLCIIGNELIYEVRNSVADKRSQQKGMGLENLRKRLDLLFPGNYALTCECTGEEYISLLKIPVRR